VTLAVLVKAAGLRRTEENFQAGKGLTSLDEHQVRRWTSWYRWVTLAVLAAAVLTIAAITESACSIQPHSSTARPRACYAATARRAPASASTTSAFEGGEGMPTPGKAIRAAARHAGVSTHPACIPAETGSMSVPAQRTDDPADHRSRRDPDRVAP